ncbi:MAG: phosphoglucosamine mutase, partial [Deltaproteobacteria bacterium]|nr:phosphoglucosamine mutase [Deltaproteobacteria bacterium]
TLDGDADRVIVVDHKGGILNGDRIMAICAVEMARRKRLAKNTVVATAMSNIGLELFLKERKIKLLRAPVGDRYVVEAMRAGRYNFGGEQSGHLIFLDHATTGDGVLAALQLLAVMVASGKKISELGKGLVDFPQMLHNIRMKHRVPLESMKGFRKAQAEFEKALGNRGRIVVRYSGTEPLLRIMVEGENPEEVERIVKALGEKAKEESR